MISEIINVARWEWFKLRFRWMPWILLTLLLLFSQIGVWGTFFFFRAFQLEDGRAGFTLPGSISGALQDSQPFMLILLAILAASTFGMEYRMGTLPMVLTRGTGRWQYLAGKFLLLATAAVGALGIVIAVTAISSLIASTLISGWSQIGQSSGWREAAVTFGKVWFSLVSYLALTGLVTVLTRSSATGTAISLGYFFTESIVAAIFTNLFDWFDAVSKYLLIQNIFVIGIDGGTAPGQVHAFVVLLVYLVALGGVSFWLFQRRDVTVASEG